MRASPHTRIGAYNYLDLMPKGRNEEGELKGWVRRRDEYE
jgi:predicted dithiol-disulfide oxidoreductase (DUF899 family)